MGKKFLGLGGTDHFWDRAKAWILNQITSAVAAKIAEVVANAPEDLDTLKEIADWIKNHANDAAAMNTQIQTNKDNIAANSNSISAMNTAILANTEAINGKADIVDTAIEIDSTWSSKKINGSLVNIEDGLGELEGKVNNLSHIKFATTRSKTNIDERLNIGTIGVYYQLYDYNSTGTKPTNADHSSIVKTEVWDIEGKYAVQEYDEMNIGNRKYMRYFNNGTWSAWRKILNTTVEDVPITYINTFKNETYVKPAMSNVCSYYVSNGNCIISIESVCLSTSTSFTQIISGLPKPKTTLYANAIDIMVSANSGARGLFQLTRNGDLNIVCDYGDTSVVTVRYFYVSFSYSVS